MRLFAQQYQVGSAWLHKVQQCTTIDAQARGPGGVLVGFYPIEARRNYR